MCQSNWMIADESSDDRWCDAKHSKVPTALSINAQQKLIIISTEWGGRARCTYINTVKSNVSNSIDNRNVVNHHDYSKCINNLLGNHKRIRSDNIFLTNISDELFLLLWEIKTANCNMTLKPIKQSNSTESDYDQKEFENTLRVHVPPFRHGCVAHGCSTISQRSPDNPSVHVQRYWSGAVFSHVPPCKQGSWVPQ